jgi:periplasmic protein TonB
MRGAAARAWKILLDVGRVLFGIALALFLALAVFLVLPILEQVGKPPDADTEIRSVGADQLPPPPPPPMEEEEEEPEEEETPPELNEEAPPLDLSQLELALNPGFGEGLGGDFAIKLAGIEKRAAEEAGEIFSMAELDQQPRVVFQPAPQYPPDLRKKKLSGTVYVLFIVDPAGRVKQPKVQSSSHPAFDQPALKAVQRWRFEPGKRKGKPVPFKMRVPITFSAG